MVSKFNIKDFKPDPELTRLADNFKKKTQKMMNEAVREFDDALREEIEFGITSSGYEYESFTLSKSEPELPALITLYPSEKKLILLGVIEHLPDHAHFTSVRTFKFRLFDGYDEVYKGSKIFRTEVKLYY